MVGREILMDDEGCEGLSEFDIGASFASSAGLDGGNALSRRRLGKEII